MKLVNGNKTYLSAAGIAIVVFLDLAEIVSLEETITILSLIGAGSIAAIRHAIKKLEVK